MRKHVLVTSLRTALLALPLMAACGGNSAGGGVIVPPGGLTLPDCTEGQLISVGADRTLGCTQALTTSLSPPSCPAGTHALNAVDGTLVCAAKGTGTTNSDLTAAINNVVTKTTNITNQVAAFGGGGGSAKYCGQTPTQPNGAFADGGATGIAAAASLCSKVAACGTGAHWCSVYEMFESVSSGAITNAMDVSKSWVYQASWSQEFSDNSGIQKEPGSGQSDNCGGGTYGTGDKHWYGSAVQWTVSDTGKKALKFFSGPANVGVPGTLSIVANPGAVPCSNPNLPIACCK